MTSHPYRCPPSAEGTTRATESCTDPASNSCQPSQLDEVVREWRQQSKALRKMQSRLQWLSMGVAAAFIAVVGWQVGAWSRATQPPPSHAEMTAVSEAAYYKDPPWRHPLERQTVTESRIVHAHISTPVENILGRAQIAPVMHDGKVEGVQLLSLRSALPDGATGFRNGDVIVRLNGYGLTDPNRAILAIRTAQQARHARFEVVRDGEPITLWLSWDGKEGEEI